METQKMKIAIITDLHFGARNDNQAFLDFQEKFYTNVFFPALKEKGITTVLNLGDTWDRRKYINFNTLKTVKKFFFDALAENNITMHMLAGNHDTYYKNTNDVNSPDLLLNEYKNVHIIDKPQLITIDGTDIAMMPWICAENYSESMNLIESTAAPLCMGHFEIDGFTMHRGMTSHGGLDPKVFKRFDMVFTGHYHHRNNNGHIYYLGNPYELTWNDYNDARGFHFFDTTTRELQFVVNPYTMFHRIEYNDENNNYDNFDFQSCKEKYVKIVVSKKSDFYKFDTFMNKLYNSDPYDVKIIEDFSEFKDGELDESIDLEDTMDVLSNYIDNVETTNVDKEKLKVFMKTLYTEAINITV